MAATAAPKPPQSKAITVLAALGAIAVTCAVCGLFGQRGGGDRVDGGAEVPAVPPDAAASTDGAPDEAATAETRARIRAECSRSRRGEECPQWASDVVVVSVERSGAGRRAIVRSALSQRDERARMVCAGVRVAMPRNPDGSLPSVQVRAANGQDILAHTGIGECTTGLW
jgi:hypothetical protein